MNGNPRANEVSLSAILAAALILSACEGDQLGNVRPKMLLDPDAGQTLGFAEVVLNRSVADPRIITVSNRGDGALTLSDARIEGPRAQDFRVSSRPKVLLPGQSGEIFVRFEPKAPGDGEANLVLSSNDPDRPSVSFPLKGPAREACAINVGPAHQSFLLGEIRNVDITAVSTHDCSITRLFTDRALFEILNEPEIPFIVPAGTTKSLEVQHIAVTRERGVPTREFRVQESEGTEAVVSFEGEPPLYGCFTISTDRIIFPRIAPGQTARDSVRLTNHCSKEALVTSAAISEGFYYFTTDRTIYPIAVRALDTVEVEVEYNMPLEELGDQGILTIGTNDAANARFRVELRGFAALPQMQAFPPSLDFGTVVFRNPMGPTQRSECASRSQMLQIFSVGSAPLTINRLEIDPAGDQEFVVLSATVDGQGIPNINQPITVLPDSEMRVFLQFYPTRSAPTRHGSRLLVHHNASPDPFAVVLLGEGVPDGAVTDQFEQLQGPKVDILWVIDDSCSMYDEQARLIQNMSRFVEYADTNNADYQMGVTTTDSRSNNAGKFRRCFPHPAIIPSNYTDREAAFACTFEVGTRGSGIEAGLGAAMRALERATNPALDPMNNPNAGFVRPDAKLAIVTMSDEEDQSLESNQVMRDYFRSVKGAHRPDRVKVHAIAGPVDHACATGERSAEPGYRYAWMTQQTGGVFFDICLEDWDPVLQQLGLETFQPVDEWDLSQAADPSSLVVTVDGVAVPRDPNSGYVFNPQGNSVRFNGPAVPTPGAQIEVNYTGLCRP